MSIAVNPYKEFLGNRNPQEVIATTPGQLAAIMQQGGPDSLERSYAPGKWSARQILCHLADCEIAFSFRLRQALAEEHHMIQPFDQELWAKPYSALEAQAALGVYSGLRHWNLALLKTVSPTDYAKPVSHPERGEMTFQTIVETMAGHDLNHLRQLQTIAALPGA
jgi:DinB superfamily